MIDPAATASTDVSAAPLLASRRHTVRFLLIVAAVAILGMLQARAHGAVISSPSSGSRVPLYLSLLGLEGGLLWFVVVGVRHQGRRFADLIGRPWRRPLEIGIDLLAAIGAIVAIGAIRWAIVAGFGAVRARTGFLLPRNAVESFVWIAVAVAAGFCEEAAFRGYLLPQLHALTGSMTVAWAGQAIVFGLAHVYQGWRPALAIILYGLVFGALAIWRRSILPGILAHALIDLIGGLTSG